MDDNTKGIPSLDDDIFDDSEDIMPEGIELIEDQASLDEKFRDIEKNVKKQVTELISMQSSKNQVHTRKSSTDINDTRKFIYEQPLDSSESGKAQVIPKHNINDNDSLDEIEDDYDKTGRELNPAYIIIAIVAAVLLLMIALATMYFVIKPMQVKSNDLANQRKIEQLEELNSDNNEKIAEYEKQISEQLDKISELNETISKYETDIADKDTEIESLGEKLKETETLLKEMEFRADMFQKYGPDWEK